MRLSLPLFSFLLLPLLASAAQEDQQILDTPESWHSHFTPPDTSMPSLADLLTIEPSASIFYSYAREVETSGRFIDFSDQNTVLVPTNKAVMALSRKPHQGPKIDDGIVISQEEFDKQSKENVLRWVSAHIIPTSVLLPSSETYATLENGISVTFKDLGGEEEPAWRRAVLNENIHIVSMKQASNGVLYLIDGTVKVD